MKELILNNSKQLEDNLYVGFITFGEYLTLINNQVITVPEVDGYHRAVGAALIYNMNKEISTIDNFNIVLHVNNAKNEVDLNNSLTIKSEEIMLIDGAYRTLIINQLDQRFMGSLLEVKILCSSIEDARKMIAQLNKQRPIML
jgi:hypothetical protein